MEPELPLTPGLTLQRQNGSSGCERASPCQSQLAFSCIQMRQIGRGACPPGHPLAWEEGVSAPWVSAENGTSFPGHAPLPRPGPRSRGASPGTSVPEFRAALSTGASASSRTCRVPGGVSSPLCESGALPLPVVPVLTSGFLRRGGEAQGRDGSEHLRYRVGNLGGKATHFRSGSRNGLGAESYCVSQTAARPGRG